MVEQVAVNHYVAGSNPAPGAKIARAAQMAMTRVRKTKEPPQSDVPFRESMTRISLPRFVIRVWRREAPDYVYSKAGNTDLVIVAHRCQELSMGEIVDELAKIPRVAAIEILDWCQNGIVHYVEW